MSLDGQRHHHAVVPRVQFQKWLLQHHEYPMQSTTNYHSDSAWVCDHFWPTCSRLDSDWYHEYANLYASVCTMPSMEMWNRHPVNWCYHQPCLRLRLRYTAWPKKANEA